MKITADTMLFVVRGDGEGVSHLTLEGVVNAVQGGMKLSEVAVFTDIGEADEYSKRMRLVSKGTRLLLGMGTDKLDQLIARIESDEIDELLEKVMG